MVESKQVKLRSPNRDIFKLYGAMVEQATVFLMRHATSELNEEIRSCPDQSKEDYLKLIFEPSSRDAKVSKQGIEEALKQRDLIKALGIKKILVSPMRRAVETAIMVTRGLGLGIQIVLTPILREKVTFKNTVCSSPAEIRGFVTDLEQRLSDEPGSQADYMINFDQVSDELWYLHMIRNLEIRNSLVKVAQGAIANEQNVFDEMKQFMIEINAQGHELWKERGTTNETNDELKQRLFDDEGIQQLLRNETERVLVVTHSNIVKHLLLAEPGSEKFHMPKKERVRVNNAQIFPYLFTYYSRKHTTEFEK